MPHRAKPRLLRTSCFAVVDTWLVRRCDSRTGAGLYSLMSNVQWQLEDQQVNHCLEKLNVFNIHALQYFTCNEYIIYIYIGSSPRCLRCCYLFLVKVLCELNSACCWFVAKEGRTTTTGQRPRGLLDGAVAWNGDMDAPGHGVCSREVPVLQRIGREK